MSGSCARSCAARTRRRAKSSALASASWATRPVPTSRSISRACPRRCCAFPGEIADGVVLWLCNPHYIRDVVVPAVSEGREKAGLPLEGFDIVAAVPSAITSEPEEARARLRTELVPYFSLPFYRAMIEASGFEEDVSGFDRGMQERGPEVGHPGDLRRVPRPARRDRSARRGRCGGAPLPRLWRHVPLRRRHHEDGLRRHARGARRLPRLSPVSPPAPPPATRRAGGAARARRRPAPDPLRACGSRPARDRPRAPGCRGSRSRAGARPPRRCPAGGRNHRRRARGRPP